MSKVNNLRIITEFGELVYQSAESLNIQLNRIVDDMTDISNRFAEFSYDFDIPIVKENSLIFSFANVLGEKRVFVKNKNIDCQVLLNQSLLLDGVINLEGITQSAYKCKFFSKFKELIDVLNEDDADGNQKTLRSLKLPLVKDWKYEDSIIDHVLTYGNLDSDATTHQYPLSFYSTYYCQESYYSGTTDIQGYPFLNEADKQNYYYLLNNFSGHDNRIYEHQVPPAIYIVSIVNQILADAGWKLGGQFFNDKNIKKIVLLYAGDEDIYDQAIAGENIFSGSTKVNLNLALFLPETPQADFLKSIINYFNLYFKVDVNNRIVEFETYDTYFNNVMVNPYDITDKVNLDTFYSSYIENNNPSISFVAPNNKNVMGDNYVMSGSTNNAFAQVWVTGNNTTFNQTFNRVGTTDKIQIDFSAPTIKRHIIYNDKNIFGVDKQGDMMYFYLPLLSKQKPFDNNGMNFNKNKDQDYLFNNESTIKFQGTGSLMYHYGTSQTNYENKGGDGVLADYLYYNMYTRAGNTLTRLPITFCSPFQLQPYRNDINAWLNGVTFNNISDRRTTVATYLQTLWQIMGSTTGVTDYLSTDFSLVFDDNGYLHDTLWSKFHKNKWDRYQQSEQVEMDMRMTAYDWQEMQINRPIMFRGELYSIMAIEGYNPIAGTSKIRLIKKL